MTRAPPDSLNATARSGRAEALRPSHDCDVCVVGDDLAGLLIAHDLSARGREVVLVPPPRVEAGLELEGTLSSGLGLLAGDLVERLGRVDAAELLAAAHGAAQRGQSLAQTLGVPLGRKGRLAVAQPAAAGQLVAAHEALEEIAPGSSRLLPRGDIAGLLDPLGASSPFTAALGLAPGHRVDGRALRAALEGAARAAGVRILDRPSRLAADVLGLRKYVTLPELKIRAYTVVFSGLWALRRVAPRLAPSLVARPWVSGSLRLAGGGAPYGGLVEEIGGTGLRWHWEGERLMLAAETATLVRGGAAALRVLGRHARRTGPGMEEASVESALGVMRTALRRRMPVIQEGEKGVYYCATASLDEPVQGLLGAELVASAIAERDDRLLLLAPFGLEPTGTRPVARSTTFLSYWRLRWASQLVNSAESALENERGAAPVEGIVADIPPPVPRRAFAPRSLVLGVARRALSAGAPRSTAQKPPRD